ncbi:cell death in tomato 1 [Setomelanomma holmii]|uniref:Cell death in tomato 1 n=1 Tax=Setomelanomma holmii TaxID=210430 RepID=A0A9P4LV50_9PLEO|nr:cell death in tomato 1 [Setomelanomma holmii]
MQFTTTTLAAIMAFTSSTLASPLQSRQSTLQDFQVTSVSVFTPSGRPETYPWSTLTANITDPNEVNLGPSKSDGQDVVVPAGSQGVNCVAKYFSKGENPIGRTWPCDPTSQGYWTMQVLPGSSGSYSSTDFKLKFTHVADVLYLGSEYTASFVAEGGFEVGDNMSGTCGSSGRCAWGLKQEDVPVLIAPVKQ